MKRKPIPSLTVFRNGDKHEIPHPLIDPTFILEQELDEIPSYCECCGRVHGTEACQYEDDEPTYNDLRYQ